MPVGERVMYGLIVTMLVAVIGATAWLYLVKKDYPFIVEAACDPAVSTCFYRACSDTSNTGDCPPNALEYYTIYSIAAKDFAACEDNSCKRECETEAIECEEWPCGESPDDICSELPIAEHDLLDTSTTTAQ